MTSLQLPVSDADEERRRSLRRMRTVATGLLGFAAMAFRSVQVAITHHRRGYTVLERPESTMDDR